MTNIAPDGTVSYSQYVYGQLVLSTNLTVAMGTAYTYDPHGRPAQSLDARSGATTFGYNDADQVTTNTTPSPTQTTITVYNNALQPWRVILPDGTSVTNTVYLTGGQATNSGSRTYPVAYTQDYAGRQQSMKTWTNYATGTGAATTSWGYDAQRGWLTSKTYNDNSSVTYSNTFSGRLAQRKWARNVTTAYAQNAAGELTLVDYSDSTPDVGYGYDRRGRQTTVTNGGSLLLTRAYNDAGQLLGEGYASGVLNGLAVSNRLDGLLRRTNVAVFKGATLLTSAGYSFDSASRWATVGDGTNSATYGYLANSPLIDNVQFKQNGTVRLTRTNQFDKLNRQTNLVWMAGSSVVASFARQYNDANQCTRETLMDGSYWLYQYDSLGQLKSAKKYWSDGVAVNGQQFDFGFDDIGNRKNATRDSRQSDYTVNLVNQYTQRTVPGYVNIIGEATNSATVMVNEVASTRRSNYFRVELPVSNSSSLWQGLTNIAVLNQG